MADTTATAEKAKKPRQGRSPAYPGIDLRKALEKAKALHDAEGSYAVPMPSAFSAWGFSAKSSGGRETRAALRYFGIITVEGDSETGKVKLTENTLRILLDKREDETEKKAIIRELALTPAVHKQLLTAYPQGIKSEASAVHSLIFDFGYNQAAAAEIVKEFNATAAYAGLYEPDMVVDKFVADPVQDARVEAKGETPPPPLKPLDRVVTPTPEVKIMTGERELTTGLLAKGSSFRLIVSGAIGVKEIDRLIQKLQIDKEILADQDEVSEGEGDGPFPWQSKAQPAQMPFMITQAQKQQLRDLGYSEEAISNMTPQRSLDLLAGGIKAPPY